jgi:lipoate-protein ligase A
MTGGGVVEHGSDVTYSLIIPPGHALEFAPPRESYRLIHEAIAEWLSARGIVSVLAPTPDSGPAQVCFQSAAESDLVSEGNKIAGAAQRRTRRGLLHQGSLLCAQISECDRNDFSSAFVRNWTAECADEAAVASAMELAARKYGLESWTRRV